MAKEMDKDKMDQVKPEEKGEDQKKPDDTKPDEPKDEKKKEKKEFFLIRGLKKVGSGLCKVGRTIDGFAHEHPYGFGTITLTIGAVAMKGYELLTGSESGSDEGSEEEGPEIQLSLPEGETEETTTFPSFDEEGTKEE